MPLVVVLGATLSISACDGGELGQIETAVSEYSPMSTELSAAPVERTYIVPSNIDPDVFAAAEADALARNCSDNRPMVLPAGTRVRVVEGEGRRRIFLSPSGATSAAGDRAERASVAGNAHKGNGIVDASAPTGYVSTSSTEFTCSCNGGPQNQNTGCTPAYNPDSGHTYCDAYGSCNQCKMTITGGGGPGDNT